MCTEVQVIQFLQMSLQAKNIKQSEEAIEQARLVPGFTTILLLIADNPNHQINLRQTAIVNLKTTVDRYYVPKKQGDPTLVENDKAALRDSLLKALIRSSQQSKLIPSFCQIIYSIAYHDYPARWVTLLTEILDNLKNSSDFNVLYGSLLALKSLISVYSTELEESRIHIYPIINHSFNILQLLASKVLQNYNDQTGAIFLVIVKIFSLATFASLPPSLRTSQSLHVWLIFVKQILDCKAQESSPDHLIKAKRKCTKILYRFIQHHANPKYDQQFSDYFLNKYGVRFLESLISQIISPHSNKAVVNLSLACLPNLYKNQPKCQLILTNYKQKLIPLILSNNLLNKQDIAMWTDDPVEFLNREKQSRKYAIEVIKMYPNCGAIVTQWLLKYLNDPDCNDIQKEIYLFMFSELSNEIIDEINATDLVKILSQHIIPLMKHESDLLKARGCEVYTSYADIILPQTILSTLTQNIYSCFMSTIIPIKVHAALAFSQLLQQYSNIIPLVSPFLADILSTYVKLIELVDNQYTVHSLQAVIKIMSQNISPYAVKLIQSLSDLFFKYCQKEGIVVNFNDDEELEDEIEQNAGDGCLAAIRQILNSNLPLECYEVLAQEIYRLISFILSQKSYNYLEQGLNILNLYLFKIPKIPYDICTFYPLLCYMVINVPIEIYSLPQIDIVYKRMITNIADGADKDIVQEVVGSMRNYIAKMKSEFFTMKDIVGVTYIERMFQCIEVVKANDKNAKLAIISTLYITLIQNNMGSINELIPNILSFAITELKGSINNHKLMLINLEIILMCFFYDAKLTLELLASQSLAISVFEVIISNISLFKADYEQQRLVLAIIRLLELEPNTLQSAGVHQNYISTFLKSIVFLAQSIIQGREKQKDESDCSEAEEDDNSHAFSQVNNQKQKELEQDEKQVEWEEQYNKLYTSPLEGFDEIIYIGDFLKGNGSRYVSLLTTLQQQNLSNSIMKASVLKKIQ